MRTRCFRGLTESYLQSIFVTEEPLDHAFYNSLVQKSTLRTALPGLDSVAKKYWEITPETVCQKA